MTASIADIAKKAGVSKMTVSRVINKSSAVRPETRKQIQKIIKQMGYKPNALAQNLSSGLSLDIGAVITGIENVFNRYYFTEMIRHLENFLDEKNQSLFIFNVLETENKKEVERKLKIIRDYYHSKVIKGVIVLGPPDNDERINYLSRNGVKGLAIGSKIKSKNFGSIDIDNKEAVSKVVDHLIDSGHKKIAIINGPQYMNSAQEREKAFAKRMRERKQKVASEHIVCGSYTREGGYTAAKKLLSLKNKPTAIFATNDDMAAGIYDAARELKMKIPRDISIAGFDDVDFAASLDPALTTIGQPYRAIGELAATHFVKQDFSIRVELPGVLMMRDSVATL